MGHHPAFCPGDRRHLFWLFFTPTEAAGIGAVGAFVISALRGRLTFTNIREALMETVTTTAMIFTILIGALTLNNLMVFFRDCGRFVGICLGS